MAEDAKKTKDIKDEAPVVDAPETETPEVKDTPEAEAPKEEQETFAKAGKRSKKNVEAAEAEAARQARKADTKAAEAVAAAKPKGAIPVTRPKIERRGKKYQEAAKLIEKGKVYPLAEAIDLALKTNPVKFDATFEMHARLGVDPRQADQNIRTTIVLPHGNGKSVRVAVFAPLDEAKKAKAAGADIAGDEEIAQMLEKGNINFDVLIATPQFMPKLGKFARLLGPKGLMPNPKSGTVTTDVEKAVKEAKAGKVEYRVDKQAIVHIGFGKASFKPEQLVANAETFLESLKQQKPASLKGTYIKSLYLTTSMGPSIAIENLYN